MTGYLHNAWRVVGRIEGSAAEIERMAESHGGALALVADAGLPDDLDKLYFDGAGVRALPARPSLGHDWNGTAWVESLARAKALKNAEINAARLTANLSTFTFAGHPFDANAESRSSIDGINGYVALQGALSADFPGMWKAADNAYVSIPDVTTWKAFYAAMVAQGTANYLRSEDRKAAIAAATTAAAVAAITWEAS